MLDFLCHLRRLKYFRIAIKRFSKTDTSQEYITFKILLMYFSFKVFFPPVYLN